MPMCGYIWTKCRSKHFTRYLMFSYVSVCKYSYLGMHVFDAHFSTSAGSSNCENTNTISSTYAIPTSIPYMLGFIYVYVCMCLPTRARGTNCWLFDYIHINDYAG